MADVDQDLFADSVRIATDRKTDVEDMDLGAKTLESGYSTIIRAALDSSLKGKFGERIIWHN